MSATVIAKTRGVAADSGAVLVVGQGSIGRRHVDVLKGLGQAVLTVSRRESQGDYQTIKAALGQGPCKAVVVATETARHAADLTELARCGYSGPVLVEKPAAAMLGDITGKLPTGTISVGYNLRFLPVVRALRAVLVRKENIIAAHLHVGQALQDWRPGRGKEASYSAFKAQGGGALRDLSHELDLAVWLFGPAARVAAIGGRFSEQTVDSDDAWSILLTCRDCPQVTVTLNCIERPARRRIDVTTASGTLSADLLTGKLGAGDTVTRHAAARDESYRAMWQAFLSGGAGTDLCSWNEGLRIVALIEAAEAANRTGRWVVPEGSR